MLQTQGLHRDYAAGREGASTEQFPEVVYEEAGSSGCTQSHPAGDHSGGWTVPYLCYSLSHSGSSPLLQGQQGN